MHDVSLASLSVSLGVWHNQHGQEHRLDCGIASRVPPGSLCEDRVYHQGFHSSHGGRLVWALLCDVQRGYHKEYDTIHNIHKPGGGLSAIPFSSWQDSF
jgi:hypothetical protein